MMIELHLTGNERKGLVKAVSEIIGAPSEYQYMPTCAYKIGRDYTITKEGNLEISDSADSKEVENLIDELVRKLRKAGAISHAGIGAGVHIHIGANGHTPPVSYTHLTLPTT